VQRVAQRKGSPFRLRQEVVEGPLRFLTTKPKQELKAIQLKKALRRLMTQRAAEVAQRRVIFAAAVATPTP
jgi:hypothetical protein